MKKNPKMIAGITGLAVLVILLAVLLTQLIPTAGEVRREMSLTPTPLPPTPDTVRASAVSPDAPTAVPPLQNGSRGDEVLKLQTRLHELGYYQGELDGQFGAGTQEAVVAFQKADGLDTDGLAGAETQRVLYSEEAKAKPEEGQ